MFYHAWHTAFSLFIGLQFFSLVSPDAVDMSFEITIRNQFCQHKLDVGWNRTGKKAEFFMEGLDE